MNDIVGQKFNRQLARVAFWFAVAFFVIYSLIPFYWAINTSLKTPEEIRGDITYFPRNLTWRNYELILSNEPFLQSIVNSLIVAGSATVLSLILGIFSAYALGRMRFSGRYSMRYIILAMNIFPTISILPSVLQRINELGLFGSISSLVLTYPLFVLPYIVWTLIVFFQTLPKEIEQAAFVDGATPMQIFVQILLPIALPVLITTGLLSFISLFNEYTFALTFTSIATDQRTVPVAIAFLSGQSTGSGNPLADLMTASIIVTIPIIVLVLIMQRAIVGETTEGAVKG